MKLDFILPIFTGFYGSNFECDCESNEIEETKNYDDYNFDYKDYNYRVTKACCNAIEEILTELNFPCTITFKGINSPKFYNYSNDKIECSIKFRLTDLKRIIKECSNKRNIELFEDYLERHFKSRSGFISFYEYDVNTWLNEYLKKDYENFDLCLQYLLNFYLEELNEYNDDSLLSSDYVSSETCYVSAELKTE